MRSTEDYVWAMDEWLKCKALNPVERNIINQLRECAVKGEFEQSAETFFQLFTAPIVSAINKARLEGILKEWPRAKDT